MKTTPSLRRAALAALCALTFAAPATAQDNPLSYHTRYMYAGIKLWLTAAAERMPAEHFSFRPTPAVRSFGEIVGHIVDAQYARCSLVLGETLPARNVEKTTTAKADLIAALLDVAAYCDRAYDGMTDAAATEIVKLGPGMPKLGVLTINTLHNTLHYGNLITYMRLKNVAPPSSDPTMMPKPPKR